MSIPVKHLEASFEKAVTPLIGDDEKAVRDYNRYMEEAGYEKGRKNAVMSKGIAIFSISFGIVAAVLTVVSIFYWNATRFPATECAQKECPEINFDKYCPMPSKASWSDNLNTREKFLEYTFRDGTKCWKHEGSGSATCILP